MKKEEKHRLVERYIANYNTFNIDDMMSVIHPDIEFMNVYDGEVNITATGADEFRQLMEHSKKLFISHQQTEISFHAKADQASVEVAYEGVLAKELPNGMKAGETLRLTGRSDFKFRDGKIYKITDIN